MKTKLMRSRNFLWRAIQEKSAPAIQRERAGCSFGTADRRHKGSSIGSNNKVNPYASITPQAVNRPNSMIIGTSEMATLKKPVEVVREVSKMATPAFFHTSRMASSGGTRLSWLR